MTHPTALECLACDGYGVRTNSEDRADGRGEHQTTDRSETCEECGGSGEARCACGDPAIEMAGEEALCRGCAIEHRARAAKVRRIVAVIPGDKTPAGLAALPQLDRDLLAAQARCRRPSPETWRLVVEAVARRRPRPSARGAA